MKISAVREQTVEAASVLVRARCPACGCHVDVVTPAQAGELLKLGNEALQALLGAGTIHAIETPSGPKGVCKDSLFTSSAE